MMDYVAKVGQMVAEDKANEVLAEIQVVCDDCGGVKITDQTPKWVIKEARSLCECDE